MASAVGRATRAAHWPARTILPTRRASSTVARATGGSGSALVVGGGFAGLAAAQVLVDAGLSVTLLEQGRGLGGRVCTRTVRLGPDPHDKLTFDHGCQYLTVRSPQFGAALEALQAQGVVGRWASGRVGSALLRADGALDVSSFAPEDPKKALWVGVPTNSAVGRALAAHAGPRLECVTGTVVERLRWDASRRVWRAQLGARVGGHAAATPGAADVAARLQAQEFDFAITALSGASTARLLGASAIGGAADGPIAPRAAAAAGDIRSNVCWALMVALNKRIELPIDGALLTAPSPAAAPATGAQASMPTYGPIAWVARDSTKPGRPAVAGGSGEAWVVHGGPDWSNARREASPREVAQELLAEFGRLVQTPLTEADVVHMEAHRWGNAYPLNPRPPEPAPGGGGGGEAHAVLEPRLRLGVCGDWCKGPRANDAYVSGWEAARALLQSV